VGSLMFEIMYWPINPQIEFWRVIVWQPSAFVYPVERTLIALIATVVGVPLIRALRAYGFEIGGAKTNATLQGKH